MDSWTSARYVGISEDIFALKSPSRQRSDFPLLTLSGGPVERDSEPWVHFHRYLLAGCRAEHRAESRRGILIEFADEAGVNVQGGRAAPQTWTT